MNSKQFWAVILVAVGILVFARAFACQNPNDNHCCGASSCEWISGDCGENGACSGVPRLDYALQNGNVNVRDMPLAYYPAKGPAFQLRMTYTSARDDARQQSRVGVMGYRWEHEYEMSLRQLGTSSKWRWERLGGRNIDYVVSNGVWRECFSMGHNGKYALSFDGSNVVARRVTWTTMANKLQKPSCSSGNCGGNPWGNPDVVEFLPPYASWSPKEGYVFEPVPTKAKMFVAYRLKTIIAPDGGEMELEYGVTNVPTVNPKTGKKALRSVSVLQRIHTADGKVASFQYDKNMAFVTNVYLPDGRYAAFEYSQDGRNMLTAITDMAGLHFGFTYETNGLMTGFIKPNQQTTHISNQRTPDGLLMTSIQQPEGNGKFVYDDEQTTLEGPTERGILVRKIKNGLFSFGAGVVRIEDGDGLVTEYKRYDGTNMAAVGQDISKTLPNGTREDTDYDAMGRRSGERYYDATNRLYRVHRVEREYFPDTPHTRILRTVEETADGRILSERIEEYARDDRGTADNTDDLYHLAAIKTRIDSERMAEQRFDYDRDGRLLAIRERTGDGNDAFVTTKTYKYDENGRVVNVVDVLANSIAALYDDSGRVISMVRTAGGNSTVTSYEYDNLDRVIKKTHPDKTTEQWVYASCGCGLESRTDRAGDSTLYQYDRNGRKIEEWIVSNKGTKQGYKRFYYDNMDRQIAVEDALSNRTQTIYTPGGLVKSTVDPLGRVTSNEYDRAGNLVRTIRPNGLVQTKCYNLRGQQTVTLNCPVGGGEPMENRRFYDELGRKVSETDAQGNTMRYEFDMLGHVVKIIGPDGTVIENEYDLRGNQTAVIGPYHPSSSESRPVMRMSYDQVNRLISRLDALGREKSWEYSQQFPRKVRVIHDAQRLVMLSNEYDPITGDLTATSDYGVQTKFERDTLGRVISTTYRDGTLDRRTYDGVHLVQSVSRSGVTNENEYNIAGRLVATKQAENLSLFGYDAVGNLSYLTDALGQKISNRFDLANKIIETIRPDGSIAGSQYDGLERLTAKIGAGQLPISQSYDAVGRLSLLKDGNDNPTHFDYDSMGRLIKKTYSDSKFHAYSYDAAGRVLSRRDPNENETRYFYDLVGQLLEKSYAHDGTVQYAYDLLGRMTQRVDKAGVWSWTYDGGSKRVLSESLQPADGTERQTIIYAYDPTSGERISLSVNGKAIQTYEYAAGRLVKISSAFASFEYSYQPGLDAVRDIMVRNVDGELVSETIRELDTAGRLVSEGMKNAKGEWITRTCYTYDKLGRRITKEDTGGCVTDFGYDVADQLTSAQKRPGCGSMASALYRYLYGYDMAGNRLLEERGTLKIAGRHNNLNQLVELGYSGDLQIAGNIEGATGEAKVTVAGEKASVVDGTNFIGTAPWAGNVTGVAMTAESGNQTALSSVAVTQSAENPQRLEYDANGNLIRDGLRKYSWDDENRLVAVEDITHASGAHKSLYDYDAQGRRIKKTVFDWGSTGDWKPSYQARFAYDGWNLIAEIGNRRGSLAAFTNYYVWGLDLVGQQTGRLGQESGGIGGLLAAGDDAARNVFSYDGHGNLCALLDSSTGNVAARFEYDPYGRLLTHAGTAASPFQFSTKYTDPETGLLYYGYRFYSPSLGRWLSKDPLGDIAVVRSIKEGKVSPSTAIRRAYAEFQKNGGGNLYCLVYNSPITAVDLLGLACTVRFNCSLSSETPQGECNKHCEYSCSSIDKWETLGSGLNCEDVPENMTITEGTTALGSLLCNVTSGLCGSKGACDSSFTTQKVYFDANPPDRNCSRAACINGVNQVFGIADLLCDLLSGAAKTACQNLANLEKSIGIDGCNAWCNNP